MVGALVCVAFHHFFLFLGSLSLHCGFFKCICVSATGLGFGNVGDLGNIPINMLPLNVTR